MPEGQTSSFSSPVLGVGRETPGKRCSRGQDLARERGPDAAGGGAERLGRRVRFQAGEKAEQGEPQVTAAQGELGPAGCFVRTRDLDQNPELTAAQLRVGAGQ